MNRMSDLISRGELFNRLAPIQTLGEAYGVIQGMPTADVHGRWKVSEKGAFCSVCHIGWSAEKGIPANLESDYRYCPCCGARMDK